MEKATQRLNLLFLNHEHLLAKDIGLRLPASKTKPEIVSSIVQTVTDEKSLPDGKHTELSSSVAVKAGKKAAEAQIRLNHPEDKDVDEPDERTAFESGIETSPPLITQSFCPAAAIMKLPYKYMRGDSARMIGRRFFDGGQFWSREWDLYYIFPPRDLAPGPLLLLHASQVQQFLDLISKDYGTRLTIPMDPELGLLLSFQEPGMPQPQYLGRSSDKDIKDDLVSTIPVLPESSVDCIDPPSDEFRQKMEAGLNATRKKSKASKEKRRLLKIEKQREWVRSLKRAQCYLGLHPRCSDRTNGSYDSVHQSVHDDGLTQSLPPLSLDTAAPFPFVDEPIFISVDVEWNERQRNQITEVGISTLDTLDIAHVAPGQGGKNWKQWIRSRHIRIKEYAHIVNGDFVSGCPDQFGFGKSEFISLKDAAGVVEACFNPPYSAQVPVKFIHEESTGAKPKVTIETAIQGYKLRPRNVVLVGHDLQGDIDYLRALGCNLFSSTNSKTQPQSPSQISNRASFSSTAQTLFLDTLDTAAMFHALKRDVHSRALGNVLNSLGTLGWNLHNAGNDARYTLEAMVHMVINARVALDKGPQELSGNYMDWAARPVTNADTELHELAWQAEVERRVSEAAATSEAQIRDDCKIWEMVTGWDSGDRPTADDIDGGEPKGFMISK